MPSMCAIDSRSIFINSSSFAGDNGGLGALGSGRPFCCRPFSFLSLLIGEGDGTKGFIKVSVEAEAQEEIEAIWDDEPVSEESLPRLRFLRMSVNMNFFILTLRRSLELPCSRKEKSEG